MMNNNILHTYVRDRKNNPIGVVVAVKLDNKIHCGWSLTKRTSGDKFNRETGLSIALGRAVVTNGFDQTVPQTVKKTFTDIVVRAGRYFKETPFA